MPYSYMSCYLVVVEEVEKFTKGILIVSFLVYAFFCLDSNQEYLHVVSYDIIQFICNIFD